MKAFVFVLAAILIYAAANGTLVRLWDDVVKPRMNPNTGGGGGSSGFG